MYTTSRQLQEVNVQYLIYLAKQTIFPNVSPLPFETFYDLISNVLQTLWDTVNVMLKSTFAELGGLKEKERELQEVRPGEVYRFSLHEPPLTSVSPSCSPQWPSAVSGHHLFAVAPPANHTHRDVSNLRHTTSESTPQVHISDQFTTPRFKSELARVETENLTVDSYLQSTNN